jgi:hypothetical protein
VWRGGGGCSLPSLWLKRRGLARTLDGSAAGSDRGSTKTPGRVPWAQRGPAGQVKEGWNTSVRRSDSEVVWQLSAWRAMVSMLEQGSAMAPARSQSCGEGRER